MYSNILSIVYAVILVVLSVNAAKADDAGVYVHVASWHPGHDTEYNQVNHGFGMYIDTEIGELELGTYKNSEGAASDYIQVSNVWKKYKAFDLGYSIGTVNGYSAFQAGVPYILPYVQHGALRIMIVPVPVPALGFSFKF